LAGVIKKTKKALESSLSGCCSDFSPKEFMYNRVPMMKWLPNYDVKKDLLADVIAGLTVAVMNIPQGKHLS
jgi:hypothetical protein